MPTPPLDPRLLPKDAPFQVRRVLGAGGGGTVLQVLRDEDPREVVVKRQPPARRSRTDAASRRSCFAGTRASG